MDRAGGLIPALVEHAGRIIYRLQADESERLTAGGTRAEVLPSGAASGKQGMFVRHRCRPVPDDSWRAIGSGDTRIKAPFYHPPGNDDCGSLSRARYAASYASG
jgi:hypothetical protein